MGGASLFDSTELVSLLLEMKQHSNPLLTAIESLTEREEVGLGLVSAGKTNGQIAEELNFSIGTIKKTVQDIISKLGVSDRTQAAVEAARLGWGPGDREEQS